MHSNKTTEIPCSLRICYLDTKQFDYILTNKELRKKQTAMLSDAIVTHYLLGSRIRTINKQAKECEREGAGSINYSAYPI